MHPTQQIGINVVVTVMLLTDFGYTHNNNSLHLSNDTVDYELNFCFGASGIEVAASIFVCMCGV